MSLMVAPEEDRLLGVEAKDEETKFEDAPRTVEGRGVIFGLEIYWFEGDLPIVCTGVDERLSGFSGREGREFCIGDRAFGEENSMRNRGVTCNELTGDDGGNGVVEAVFKEA